MEQIDEVAATGVGPGGAPDDDGLGDGLEVPRRGRTGLVVSAIVAVVALAFVALLATREPAADREATSPIVGKAAPALAGETLDGGSFDIDDHQGRWVVVNFFATWCTPCRQEHPELVSFDEAHGRPGDAEVVSVLYSDQVSTARDYFADNGGEWPVVIDPDGQVALDYGLVKVPETYVVAPNGVVVAKLIGGVTRDGLDRVIADAQGTGPAAGGGGG